MSVVLSVGFSVACSESIAASSDSCLFFSIALNEDSCLIAERLCRQARESDTDLESEARKRTEIAQKFTRKTDQAVRRHRRDTSQSHKLKRGREQEKSRYASGAARPKTSSSRISAHVRLAISTLETLVTPRIENEMNLALSLREQFLLKWRDRYVATVTHATNIVRFQFRTFK